MPSRSARFEIVRTDAGWHARFRAGNGRAVWSTDVYTRRQTAVEAIGSMADVFYGHVMDNYPDGLAVTCLSARDSWNKTSRPVAAIWDVDTRTADPAEEPR